MFAVTLILLSILVVAVAVVLIVALPQLRSGSEIFTEDGKQAVARAGQRAGQVARTGPIAVVGGTKQLLRPMSDKLHAQMDRLDDRQPRETSGATAAASAGRRSPSPADDSDHHRADRHPADHHIVGYRPADRTNPTGRSDADDDWSDPAAQTNPAMVSPRPVPEESGPIPELPAVAAVQPMDAAPGARDVVPPRLGVVIDLRDTDTDTDPAAVTSPMDKPIEHPATKRNT